VLSLRGHLEEVARMGAGRKPAEADALLLHEPGRPSPRLAEPFLTAWLYHIECNQQWTAVASRLGKAGPELKATHVTLARLRDLFAELLARTFKRAGYSPDSQQSIAAALSDRRFRYFLRTTLGIPFDKWVVATDQCKRLRISTAPRPLDSELFIQILLPKGKRFPAFLRRWRDRHTKHHQTATVAATPPSHTASR
jgi:hypothetical protein